MWDVKLALIDLFLYYTSTLYSLAIYFYDLNELFFLNGLFLVSLKTYYVFSQNTVFVFSIKFFLCIAFLILIRGGTPRYRYDFLTKLGWLKFLSLIILIFFNSILFFFFF